MVKKISVICASVIFTFGLIIILLISSTEAVLYKNNYFKNEYIKYNVTDTVKMNIDDLLYVTDEMMAYLKDQRKDLNITTYINGNLKEFFNSREKMHMEDVKTLFIKSIYLRRICLFTLFVCVIIIIKFKNISKIIFPKTFITVSAAFFAVTVLMSMLVSTDFDKYFDIFHRILFDNELWILNPDTDLLVNIVPVPFFIDTALRIILLFMVCICILIFLNFYAYKKTSVKGRDK